ncbi:hypothetical protein FBY33_3666 [Arthrobacter sp. SLBN-112]|nr:hypothetical protein FBY33_3666 [Arthrobacter sp. SLBN-112]
MYCSSIFSSTRHCPRLSCPHSVVSIVCLSHSYLVPNAYRNHCEDDGCRRIASFEWAILVKGLWVYARGMARRIEGPASAGDKGKKPPFEVLFAVWALLAAIVGIDFLGVLAILEMVKEPQPAWVPWVSGFILLLLSVIGASFVQTLKDGDRNMRYYLSYTVLLCGFGFSWPPSWRWLLFLIPVVLVGPLWLPRARRFFDEAEDDSPTESVSP